MKREETIVNRNYADINPVLFGSEDCDKDHFFGPYARSYWLLHYVSKGFGTFTINHNEYKVGPGEIFVIPPYTETYYKADSQFPWEYIWVGFTSSIPLPAEFQNAVIKLPRAEKYFQKVLKCFDLNNGKNAYLCSCIWELLSDLMEGNEPSDDYVDQAQSIMDSEYMTSISVASIAQRLNINRSYLFDIFKKKTGISPKQYLINVRLAHAVELITVYGKSIAAAAILCGYTDVYSFSKSFKLHYGVTPSQYCKQRDSHPKKTDFVSDGE